MAQVPRWLTFFKKATTRVTLTWSSLFPTTTVQIWTLPSFWHLTQWENIHVHILCALNTYLYSKVHISLPRPLSFSPSLFLSFSLSLSVCLSPLHLAVFTYDVCLTAREKFHGLIFVGRWRRTPPNGKISLSSMSTPCQQDESTLLLLFCPIIIVEISLHWRPSYRPKWV